MDEWVKKMWCIIHSGILSSYKKSVILLFAEKYMEQEDMQCRIFQTQKDQCWLSILVYENWNSWICLLESEKVRGKWKLDNRISILGHWMRSSLWSKYFYEDLEESSLKALSVKKWWEEILAILFGPEHTAWMRWNSPCAPLSWSMNPS